MTTLLVFAGTLAAFWCFLFFGRKFEYAAGWREGLWLVPILPTIYALIAAIIWYYFNPHLPILGKVSRLEMYLVLAGLAGVMAVYASTTQWWINANPALRQRNSYVEAQEGRSASGSQESGEESSEGQQAGLQGVGEGEAQAEEAEMIC